MSKRVITFGEIMLRLAPEGFYRFVQADQSSGGYTDADIIARTPLHRYGKVRDVAHAVLYLASDEANYVTGTCLNVDGGWISYGGWCR